MKKSIFGTALLVAGVAMASTVETEYTLGVLPVSMAAGQTDIILNVPWIEAGKSEEGVAVVNLVKTANLAAGDMLLWYDGTQYQGWTIVNNAWTPTAIAKSTGVSATIAATKDSLLRGQAILLHRAGTAATTIYVVGQYKSGTPTSSIAAGSAKAPVYTLIAPPSVDDDINLKASLTGAGDDVAVDGDAVSFMKDGSFVTYSYKKSQGKWGRTTVNPDTAEILFTEATDAQMTLPVGTGLYYKRCGGEKIVTWVAAVAAE